jgi:hypothetical protein
LAFIYGQCPKSGGHKEYWSAAFDWSMLVLAPKLNYLQLAIGFLNYIGKFSQIGHLRCQLGNDGAEWIWDENKMVEVPARALRKLCLRQRSG